MILKGLIRLKTRYWHFNSKIGKTAWRFFVCLFVGFCPPRECFTQLLDVTITGEGLQIYTYVLMGIEQWGLLSVPHLRWHGTSVFMTFTPVDEHLIEWNCCHYLFSGLISVATGIWKPDLPNSWQQLCLSVPEPLLCMTMFSI